MVKWLLRAAHRPIYERRLEVLATKITSHLRPGDTVLDIGCGSGMLGDAVLKHGNCPKGVTYSGLERQKRGGEPIEVMEHQSGPLPFPDQSFDVVILADVLHHEKQEAFLLGEAARLSRRCVVVKDHKPEGFLGFWRVCFLDWAANNPYNVKCLYRYHTSGEWQALFAELGLTPVQEDTSIDLYPQVFNLIFGRRLQYFAVLQGKRTPDLTPGRMPAKEG
jgi:ubiquinone/menaquinone biosynthesis C-methylase UbiE